MRLLASFALRVVFAGSLVLLVPRAVAAADDPAPPLPPPSAPPPGAPPVAPPVRLTEAQLDELVAPVALYPDTVLASLLPATTAPLDVVAAARHVAKAGGAADAPPDGVTWEPSVVAMLQYPEVLAWMDENLPWVEAMGQAVATQQGDVLAAVQRYRARAQASGALRSDDRLVVREEPAPASLGAPRGTTVIVIVPADPMVVYVPVYDPWPLLEPGWRWTYPRPYWEFGWSYRFGGPGPWTWTEIAWGWGSYHRLYAYPRPWYGTRWRSSYAWSDRAHPWTGRWRGRPDRPIRIERPHRPTVAPTTVTRTRTTTVSPTARGDVRIERRTTPAPSPVTRPLAPAAPRTAPVPSPVPRLSTTPPAVRDRATIDALRRRGAGSLSSPATPAPRIPRVERAPTPRVERAPTPRVERRPSVPTPRVRPDPTPAGPRVRRAPAPDRPLPGGADVRRFRERGRRSLDASPSPPSPVPE
jgi:hypothetical protein